MGQYSPYAITENKTPDWKPGEELAAAAFVGIAMFIVIDVNVGIWRIFRKAQGMYYWSMKLGTVACLVDAIGVILKYLTPNPYHVWGLYTACLLVGWTIYAPAQLLALYSRLHLVNDSRKIQRWVYIMVLSTILFVIIPTWVVVWPAYNPNKTISALWSPRDAIVERYNQIAFTLVEMVLSGIYIWSLLGLLNLKSSVRQRRVMQDLIYVNLIIVSLDIVVVILVYLNRTGLSHPLQTCSYAVKLKLEFVVLNQLMAVAARGVRKTNFEERRYHDSSVLDGFSAECQQWENKSSNSPVKEPQRGQEDSQGLSHSDSIQITVPSPTFSKQDKGRRDSIKSTNLRNSQPITDQNRNLNHNEKQPGHDVLAPDQRLQPKTFLEVDENHVDTVRHKPSEAFSGSTLGSPAPRDNDPYFGDRRHDNVGARRKRSMLSPPPHRRQTGQHDDQHLFPQEQRRTPHIAHLRRRIPKNARYVHDSEDEEEEIGVHMWENRKGSLMMEVPWFYPQQAGEKGDSGL
ncbi:hypothetical protein ACLMJK_004202 [Lecanora helva]